MIAEEVYDLVLDDLFIRLDQLVPGSSVFLKLEGLNPAGSVKLKTAVALVAAAEESGRCFPRTRLIESTSGNLGVALAMVCAAKGYPLTCVTDPNANVQSRRLMEVLGAEVVVIDVRDAHGGYLQSRIDYIGERLRRDPDLHWLNQYANPAGPQAHRDRTGRAILEEIGHIDYAFIGAGTTGTLMGCAEYLRRRQPRHPDHRGGRRGLRDLRRAGRPPSHSGPGDEQAPGDSEHAEYRRRGARRRIGFRRDVQDAGRRTRTAPGRVDRNGSVRCAGRGKEHPGRQRRGGDFTGLRRSLSGDHLQRRMGGGTLARHIR